MTEFHASLLQRAWRKVDVKLAVDGEMHILRWRRGFFVDEVLFDERRVATAQGLFGRESVFGLDIETPGGARVKFVFMVDAAPDWNDWTGSMRPGGVRLETAERALISVGSLGGERPEPFRELYDRAITALGLS
ncbi:hypothetical protein [Hyphococcus sp.]|uniref:hypothetical protein n=1 Tax=Hyphococcus sp. TaxID=2038636 RepID=UPI0035C6834D